MKWKYKNNKKYWVCLVALLFISLNSYSQSNTFKGIIVGQSDNEYVNKHIKAYSIYKINTKEIAGYIKSFPQNIHILLDLSSQKFDLKLEVNDMRGIGFKEVMMTENGSEELIQKPANTYKGMASDNPSDQVRLTIDETTFEGYVYIDKKYVYFDMLSRFDSKAQADLIVVYEPSDVIHHHGNICGSESIHQENDAIHQQIKHENVSAATGNCYFLEIATEADFEYYQAYSNSANIALGRIRSILNMVEGLYTPLYNVKFVLTYQHIWGNSNDPYSGAVLDSILPQFKDYWNLNYSSVTRDIAHMFTGRQLTGSVVGKAFLSAICALPFFQYGVVANFSPVTNSTICLSAHELGHNFGASHDTICNATIMCENVQSTTPTWSSESVGYISNHLSLFGICLNENFATNVTINGTGTGQAYLKTIASNNITINSSGGEVKFSSGNVGYIEAGSSIVITPTVANSLGFHAATGSFVLMRISDVIGSCDPLAAVKTNTDPNRTEELSSDPFSPKVFPNPFTNQTTFSFYLAHDDVVTIKIIDLTGRILSNPITNLSLIKGEHLIPFNASQLQDGIYFAVITIGHKQFTKRLIKTS